MERHDFQSLRVKYLHAIKAYGEEQRPILYTDETYIRSVCVCVCVCVGFVMCVFW
jgi:hypothetical protein